MKLSPACRRESRKQSVISKAFGRLGGPGGSRASVGKLCFHSPPLGQCDSLGSSLSAVFRLTWSHTVDVYSMYFSCDLRGLQEVSCHHHPFQANRIVPGLGNLSASTTPCLEYTSRMAQPPLGVGPHGDPSPSWRSKPGSGCQTFIPPLQTWLPFELQRISPYADSVPNNYIGGSGVVTCHRLRVNDGNCQASGSVFPDSFNAFLWRILDFCATPAWGLVLHLRLVLLTVLVGTLIRQSLPARRSARCPFKQASAAVPMQVLLPLSGFSPAYARPCGHSKGRPRSRGSPTRCKIRRGWWGKFVESCLVVARICCAVWGPGCLPACVWAVPAGLPQAVQVLERTSAVLPEAWPISADTRDPAELTALYSTFQPDVSNRVQCRDTPPDRTQHCVLYQAGHPAYYFLAYVEIPCSREAFIASAGEMCMPEQTHCSLRETTPQLADGVATLVSVPYWTDTSDKTVVILDFTFWGGPVFAVLEWRYTTKVSFAAQARMHASAQWDVFHRDQGSPIGDQQHVFAQAGDVFTFLPTGASPTRRPPFAQMLQSRSLWNHSPHFIPREAQSSKWYAMRMHVTRTPQYAGGSRDEAQTVAAEAFHSAADELFFAYPKPNSTLYDLVHEGFLMRGILAATPANSTGRRFGAILCVDPRQIGLTPFFLEWSGSHIHPGQLVEHLGFAVPHGYRLHIKGSSHPCEPVAVRDEDTFVLLLVKEESDIGTPSRLSAPPIRPSQGLTSADRETLDRDTRTREPTGRPQAFPRDDPVPPDPIDVLDLEVPDEDEEEDDDFFRAGFLVFAPRYQTESVQAFLRAPCDLEFALQVVDDARQSDTVIFFDKLIPAVPQPDTAFGSLLAVPGWAQHLAIILVDARAVDGRLFAIEIRGQLNKTSFLLHVGLADLQGFEIFLRGQTMDAQEWQTFLTGDMIKFVPVGSRITPPVALEDMLRSTADWSMPCPVYEGPAPLAFLVLTDAGNKVVPIDPDVVRSSWAFKEEASRIFGYTAEQITVCPAISRIENLSILGQKCKTALVATEAVSKVPIPPGRYKPKQHVLILDARPLLRDMSWLLAPHGCVDVTSIVAPFQYVAPDGLFVSVTGAPTECRRGRTTVTAAPGTLLRLVHVHEDIEVTSRHSTPAMSESSAGESSGETSLPATSTPDSTVRGSSRRWHRSRSPRDKIVVNGTWVAGLGLAGLALSTQVFTADAVTVHTLELGDSAREFRHLDLWGFQTDYHLGLALILIFLSGCSLVSKGRRSCRLLQEPVGGDAAAQAHLNTLRSFLGALGGPWHPRLPFDLHHLLHHHDTDGEDEDAYPAEFPSQIRCAVLTYEYTPAMHSVDLQMPTTIEELVEALQPLRQQRLREHFPHLLPVLPQPQTDTAVFLSAPHWCPWGHGVCFDCSRIDNRVYGTFVPEYVNREDLLHIADLPAGIAISVWAGPDLQPVGSEDHLHTFPGMLFCFLHEGEDPPLPATLGQLLQFWSWESSQGLPVPQFQHACCLAHRGLSKLYLANPALPAEYRRGIADITGAVLSRMRIYAGTPRPTDVAINGVPCDAVLAVGDRERSYVQPAWHLVLIDGRLIQMGWTAAYTVSGMLDVSCLLADFDQYAPLGWHTVLPEDLPQTGWIEARPGRIFVLAYAQGSRPAASPAAGTAHTAADAEAAADPWDNAPDAPEPVEWPTTCSDPVADCTEEQASTLLHFVILMPEYDRELVSVHVVLPTTIEIVLPLVDQARDAQNRHRFGRLIPVGVQPAFGAVCMLAVPDWPFNGVPALFVSFAAPMRLFTLVVPSTLGVNDVLRIVDERAPAQVFVQDVPWALTEDTRAQVRTGDLFSVFPIGQPYIPTIRLADMLRSADGWHPEPILPNPAGDGFWLLTELSNHRFRFEASPDVSLRVALEWHLGSAPGQLEVLPATPAIRNHSSRGLASRQVYIALPQGLLPGIPFILDQRPILLDIVWMYAPRGRVDVVELYNRIARYCPNSHFFRLHGGSAPHGTANQQRYVHPGQTLTVEFWKRRTGASFGAPGPHNPGDDDTDSDSDNTSDTYPTGASDDHSLFERASASTQPDAGTGSTTRGAQGGRQAGVSRRDDFEMWRSGPIADALSEGSRSPTSIMLSVIAVFLLCIVGIHIGPYAHGLLAASIVRFVAGPVGAPIFLYYLAPQTLPRGTAVCWILICICLQSTAAGTLHSGAVQDTHANVVTITGIDVRIGLGDITWHANNDSCDWPLPDPKYNRGRPMPTPLRSRRDLLPQVEEPAIASENLDGLETLLEGSVRESDGEPFFLAATLVDTLIEYSVMTRKSSDVPCSSGPVSRSEIIRLVDHLPPARVYDLEDIQLHVGCTLDHVAQLLHHPPFQLAPLPCCDNTFLQGWRRDYPPLPSNVSCTTLRSVTIYTDGSYDGRNSSWAFHAIGHAGGTEFCLGWIGDLTTTAPLSTAYKGFGFRLESISL